MSFIVEQKHEQSSLSTEQLVALEHVEMEAWLDCYAAAPADFVAEVGLTAVRMDGFALFAAKRSEHTLFNRALGLGTLPTISEATLADSISWLSAHCGTSWTIPVAPGQAADTLQAWLPARGLMPTGSGVAKFHLMPATVAKDIACAYEIRLVGAERAKDFGNTTKDGFGLAEGFDKWFGALAGRQGWRTYAAYDGETPVGVGAIFMSGHCAWLGVGATLPAYRGKGVQSALLARRINDARSHGVNLLAIETHAVAGEAPNQSHRNVLRAGFREAYFRPQYQLEEPGVRG